MKFLIFFFTAEILSKVFSAENCGSFGKCCNGYVWDDQSGSCKRCSRGFYGPKCENYCPYPTYGQECQSLCNCIQQLCHPINGCKDSLKIRYTTGQTLFSKTIEGKYIPTNGSQPTKEVSVTENSTETYEDIPKGDKDTSNHSFIIMIVCISIFFSATICVLSVVCIYNAKRKRKDNYTRQVSSRSSTKNENHSRRKSSKSYIKEGNAREDENIDNGMVERDRNNPITIEVRNNDMSLQSAEQDLYLTPLHIGGRSSVYHNVTDV